MSMQDDVNIRIDVRYIIGSVLRNTVCYVTTVCYATIINIVF